MRRFIAAPLCLLLFIGTPLAGQASLRADGGIPTLPQAAGRLAGRLAEQLPLIAESAAPVAIASPEGDGPGAAARSLIEQDLEARGFALASPEAGSPGVRFLVETSPGEGRTRRLRVRCEPAGWVLGAEDFLELPSGWAPAGEGFIVQGRIRRSRESALRDAEERAVRIVQRAYGLTGPPGAVLAAVPMDVRIDDCAGGRKGSYRAILRIRGPGVPAEKIAAFPGDRAPPVADRPGLLLWALLAAGLAASLFLFGKVLDFLMRGWHTRAVFTASAIIWLAGIGLAAVLFR